MTNILFQKVHAHFLLSPFFLLTGFTLEVPAVMAAEGRAPVVKENGAFKPKSTMAERFISRAEVFFSKGQLVTPVEQNAYNLYKAVQILEPENKEANSGLDAILIAEADGVRALLGSGKFRLARQKLNTLKRLFPDKGLINTLLAETSSAENAKVAATALQTQNNDSALILLDERELESKSEQIQTQLNSLALNLKTTNEGVMIYARSDAQARWVYQQMRKAVPNYRIRGDLRIGKPAIKLLKPFE